MLGTRIDHPPEVSGLAALGLSEPVRVEVPPSRQTRRIAAVIPCFNRRADAEALLSDLARLDPLGVDLRVLLVDNASEHPLGTLATPPGVDLEHLRLSTNSGGSGGYNAGMSRVLDLPGRPPSADSRWSSFNPDFVWLVDSDARVAPDTLSALLRVMEQDSDIVAAGSAVADPITGQFFELGGHVNRKNGNYEPHVIGNAGIHKIVDCDYVAACCALVRADAVRCCGVFPDTFLNGDDIEWFIRMKRITGGRIVGVPWSHAMHPRYDRFPTWTRYYMARNAFGPLDALGVSSRARFIRAAREALRGSQQAMMGRHDLTRLHTRGLKHALRGENRLIAPAGVVAVDPNRPLTQLADALRERFGQPRDSRRRDAIVHPNLLIADADRQLILNQLAAAGFRVIPQRGRLGSGLIGSCAGAIRRTLTGHDALVAVIPARGRPDSWFLGKALVEVVPGGFVMREPSRIGTPARAGAALLSGMGKAARIARVRHAAPGALDPEYRAAIVAQSPEARAMSVEAVVLSYNRKAALDTTLRALLAGSVFGEQPDPDVAPRTITVVDNGSTDGTIEHLRGQFPRIKLRALDANLGVEAFNEAVLRSTADAVLILDDDATPDDRGLICAIDALAREKRLGAVTLHPIHPRTSASEWPFAASLAGSSTDLWPVMGCGNLVRRSAWNAVGGYEKAFFLYRNDADLALKLLAAGYGVRFDPALIVRHDSPAAAQKSPRWHDLATRNWVWMARRHGRGLSGLFGALMGWAWAHKLAGLSIARHAATLKGAGKGVLTAAPTLGELQPGGEHFARLINLRLGR